MNIDLTPDKIKNDPPSNNWPQTIHYTRCKKAICSMLKLVAQYKFSQLNHLIEWILGAVQI